jgi:small subunit ribosomal protein S1/4-hydroxy-3-methylbut-2-enyl diphosphate reductase
MNQTHQQPSADDWRAFVARSGDVLDGVVSAVAPFGAFVRFEEGVDGLIPTVEARRELGVGDRVSVRVLQLDAERRRVSLREV